MIGNANAMHENHEQVDLGQLRPLQGLIDLREDEDILPVDEHDHPLNQQQQQQQPKQINRQHFEPPDARVGVHCPLGVP